MSTTHASADTSTVTTTTATTTTTTSDGDAGAHRFRAATIEDALADARAQLGDVEIVEANRIRRGGVGGFFATDLGVELVVRVPADRGTVREPLDDEYVDTTVTGSLPRAAERSQDDRPPFYDRMHEEAAQAVAATRADDPAPMHPHAESITAELERLLSAATATERSKAGLAPAPREFADHLADHLGTDPSAGRRNIASRNTIDRNTIDHNTIDHDTIDHNTSSRSNTDRAATERPRDTASARPRAGTAPTPRPVESEPVATRTERQVRSRPIETEVVEPRRERPVATPVADERTAQRERTGDVRNRPGQPERDVVEVIAPEAPEAPVDTTNRRSAPRTPATRDPWRKSIDLAAGAVGRLVEQLSDVAPAEGSRMSSLSRLTVSVTTPDGAVIELTAELEGNE